MKKKLLFITLIIVAVLSFATAIGCGGNPNAIPGEGEKYVLSINGNGGTVSLGKMDVEVGKPIGELPTPERTGYTFIRWATGNVEVYSGMIWTMRESVIVKAEWQANVYDVVFEELGGTPVEDTTFTYDQAIGELPLTHKDELVFIGWKLEGTDDTEILSPSLVWKQTNGATLVAVWREYGTYQIVYENVEGAIFPEGYPTLFKSGEEVTLLNPTKEGYEFKGWQWTVFGGSYQTELNVTFTGGTSNRNFKAIWAVSDAREYNITWRFKIYKLGGGSVTFDQNEMEYFDNLKPNLPTVGYHGVGVTVWSEMWWYTKHLESGGYISHELVLRNLQIVDKNGVGRTTDSVWNHVDFDTEMIGDVTDVILIYVCEEIQNVQG